MSDEQDKLKLKIEQAEAAVALEQVREKDLLQQRAAAGVGDNHS